MAAADSLAWKSQKESEALQQSKPAEFSHTILILLPRTPPAGPESWRPRDLLPVKEKTKEQLQHSQFGRVKALTETNV